MVKKAIIPIYECVARGLPLTKVIPKEMFPIDFKPAIHYVVEEAMRAGIDQFLFIISKNNNIIIDYFDDGIEMEVSFQKGSKEDIIECAPTSSCSIYYKRQPYDYSLRNEVKLWESFIGNDPFAVLLPNQIMCLEDNLILEQLIRLYSRMKKSIIAIKALDKNKNQNILSGKEVEKEIYILDKLGEINGESTETFSTIGRFIFTPDIFNILNNVGEKENKGIFEVVEYLIQHEICYGKVFSSKHFDIYNNKEYLELVNYIYESRK